MYVLFDGHVDNGHSEVLCEASLTNTIAKRKILFNEIAEPLKQHDDGDSPLAENRT